MSGLRGVMLVGWLLAAGSATAVELVNAELLNNPFDEVYRPEVQVSGSVIVGVMSTGAQAALASDRLGIAAGPEQETEVCVRATSNDGIYSSRNHYRLPATAGGPVRLPYRSGMSDVLAGYGPGEIAVSVSVGDCDVRDADTYLVASTVPEPPGQLIVYLNSFGATDVYLAEGEALTPCEFLAEGRRTTYDFVCTAPMPGPNGQGTREVTIVRERFGREQPAVVFRLAGSGP